MIAALVLLVLTAVGGPLLVLWLMRPEAIIRRGRNALVGIRIPSTMASDEAWAEAHRAAWPATRASSLLALALFVVLTGAGLLLHSRGVLPGGDPALAMALSGMVSMIVWAVGMIGASRIAGRAAHEVAARNGARPW